MHSFTKSLMISGPAMIQLPPPGRFAALLVFGTMVVSLTCRVASAQGSSVVTAISPTVWRIDKPDVKQKETSFQQITFLPGDQVSVAAGGCVQTGGVGKTWKRYVDPSGPDAGKLYHGLIDIPGLTNGPVRLLNFGLNTAHALPTAAASQGTYLRLGYEDDGYGDNGYNAHDDGTGDQCKDVIDAFVIVSIGHGVAPVPAGNFVSVAPASFRCQAAWAFINFDTARLSLDSFKRAFDLHWYDYLDPATMITYYAARGSLAKGGNCAGLSLLADVAQDQFLVADLHENLWNNYKGMPGPNNQPAPNVVLDVNTAHWQQLSAYFLHDWIAAASKSPTDSAEHIAGDLTGSNFNYGLISIAHGSDGHVLVPVKAAKQPNGSWVIDVYDSNYPCGDAGQALPQITIAGSSWSYPFNGVGTPPWTGHWGGDALAYIPYKGPDAAWRKLGTNFSGLIGIIFGSGTNVVQVSDARGRHLFGTDGKPLENGPASLNQSVLRVPMHGQASTRGGSSTPPYTFAQEAQIPPRLLPVASQIEQEYAPAYDGSGTIYLVNGEDLTDLQFEVSSSSAATPARALIQQGKQFIEVRMGAGPGAQGHSTFTVHDPKALAMQGVTVRAVGATPQSAELIYGDTSDQTQTVQLQHVSMPINTATRLRVIGDTIQMSTPEGGTAIPVRQEVIDQAGMRTLPQHTIPVQKEK